MGRGSCQPVGLMSLSSRLRVPWEPCPGSGQTPTAVSHSTYGFSGACPICHRWIRLTKRTERLVRHRVPKVLEPPIADPESS
jgi:hypothetical protein